jgi:hypothetical protein
MSSKKKESVLTKQTIENKKNLPSSARGPIEGLCYHWHTTAQHSKDENYNVFL